MKLHLIRLLYLFVFASFDLEAVTAFTLSSPRSSVSTALPHGDARPKERISSLWSMLGNGDVFGDDIQRETSSSPLSSSPFSPSFEDIAAHPFASGDELVQLRSILEKLRQDLKFAESSGDGALVASLSNAIETEERRDPEIVYAKSIREMNNAKASHTLPEEEKVRNIEKWQKMAAAARRCIARFQLEGVWMGDYGENGKELVNVTYSGDTLVATKCTGDTDVRRGQVAFTADLSPRNTSALAPLEVSFDDESKLLLRYPGQGQIRHSGLTTHRFIDGQCVLSDTQFSFIWMRTRRHVVFRRPTAEETLHLLRDTIAHEDEVERMRTHVSRCFDMDMTEALARFHARQGEEDEPIRRISLNSELEGTSCSKADEKEDGSAWQKFWGVTKWRECIDRILGNTDKKQP